MITLLFSQILLIGISQLNMYIFPMEIEPFGVTEKLIALFIGILSILLFLLSISSYKKTRLKNVLYASGAFGLFAIEVFIDALEENYNILDS